MDFEGRRVAVTGAAGVVGGAVARAFHDAGAVVAGIDISEHDAPWRTVAADLIDPAGARRAAAEAGDVDVLCNMAGGFAGDAPVAGTDDRTWDFMMDLNARTVFNMSRAVAPGMAARGGGAIVNVGARAALRGAAGLGAYAASKSAVIRLTETLADELKGRGVNVNCILPSIVDTPANRAAMPDAAFGEWVPPGHIAAVALFLASPAAASIHGASIPVEGLS